MPDQLPCERESETAVFLWPRNTSPTAFILPLLPDEVEFAHGLAGVRTPFVRAIAVQPVPGFLAENLVFTGKLQIHLAPPVCSSVRLLSINDITSVIDGQQSSAFDSKIPRKSLINTEFVGVFPGVLHIFKNDDK